MARDSLRNRRCPVSLVRGSFPGAVVLRAGWRFVLWLLIVIGIGFIVATIVKYVFHGTQQHMTTLTPLQISLTEATGLLFVCIATLIMSDD